ncbi:hypothetical protein [Brevibacillus centrosporus]|uniref:hypothetical protein n=1 Tax=Brevibacillus centrosporus TaxID=54910 RepID=UPI003B01AFF9
MYIDNVRKTLNKINRTERERLIHETKKILLSKGKINASVRPAEIEKYLDNFINGKETNIKYFEGFIEALDLLFVDGAKDAFLYGSSKKITTWREILLKITNDLPSKKFERYSENEFLLKEFKALFITIVEGCVDDDEEITLQRFRILNDLLKINK